jgi:hypothetical protein
MRLIKGIGLSRIIPFLFMETVYYIHMHRTKIILLVVLAVVVIGTAWYVWWSKSAVAPVPVTPVVPVVLAAKHLAADVYPLYAGIAWGEEVATTTDFGLAGYRVMSVPVRGITDLAAVSTPFEKYYAAKLAPLGWRKNIQMEAGGPGASIMGYQKGSDYIVVSYSSVFHAGGANEPEQCPCDITLSVFSGTKR